MCIRDRRSPYHNSRLANKYRHSIAACKHTIVQEFTVIEFVFVRCFFPEGHITIPIVHTHTYIRTRTQPQCAGTRIQLNCYFNFFCSKINLVSNFRNPDFAVTYCLIAKCFELDDAFQCLALPL